MKLLMVTPYLPFPPASGGQIRTLNLLQYLSRTNDITLVCLYKYEREKLYLSRLKRYCREIYVCKRAENPWRPSTILKAIFSLYPFLIVRNYSDEAEKVLRKLLKTQEFDVIHAETFYIMPHIPKTKIPVLLVEQTIEFKVYEHFVNTLALPLRLPLYLDILKLKIWEKFYWEKASVVATVSYDDKKVVEAAKLSQNPIVIPNGAGDEMIVEKLGKKDRKKYTLLFQGNFSWLQNTEVALYLIDHIYPAIKKEIPHAEVVIAGQHTNKIPRKEGIKVINILPSDSETVKKLYRNSTIFIAPIFGPGGTRLKILAAMASGLPIISTPIGIEGLNLKDNIHALIASSPEEFVEKTLFILKNHKKYEEIRNNAYLLVKEKYNWTRISQQLEKAYFDITHLN